MRGQEARFARRLQKLLQETLLKGPLGKAYKVGVGKNLLYTLEIDATGQVRPNEEERKDLKRGQLYAFQTDILIEKVKPLVPLVVLELKYNSFNTHDVITYSAKATRHKAIYPYLRYGFVLGGSTSLSKKFLAHNQGIDFAMSMRDITNDGRRLVQLVKSQIKDAENYLRVIRNNRKTFSRYVKGIVLVP